jgi:hypothetical protein
MPDPDRARLRAVIAVERTHQRAFAGARRADQGEALAGRQIERHAAQHRQCKVTLGVHHEGFGEAFHAEHWRHGAHTGRIEATSIWL